jgi:hypothetical protein
VAVGLRVRRPFRGWIYGFGRLEVDADSDVVRVRDFDYSVESRQFLVGAADVLLHPLVRNAISRRLRVPLTDHISNVVEKLSGRSFPVGDHALLTLRLNDLSPAAVAMDDKRIVVLVDAVGIATVVLLPGANTLR